MEPYEIIAAPFKAYHAPVGTSFPDVGTEPDEAEWTLIGTSGDRSITNEGVTVQHAQQFNEIRLLGGTGPQKVVREQEGLTISMTIADVSLEQYMLALNSNSVTEGSGERSIDLHRGIEVQDMALLIVGPSPYEADGNMQYEVPKVYVSTEPEPVYAKSGDGAGLLLGFTAIEDSNGGFGTLRASDADATAT